MRGDLPGCPTASARHKSQPLPPHATQRPSVVTRLAGHWGLSLKPAPKGPACPSAQRGPCPPGSPSAPAVPFWRRSSHSNRQGAAPAVSPSHIVPFCAVAHSHDSGFPSRQERDFSWGNRAGGTSRGHSLASPGNC